MKTFSFVNVKGGSTKSTNSIHLAEALSRRGRVLLVDLDSQADVTDYLLPETEMDALDRGNALTFLMGETTLEESLQKADFCDVLPATINLADLSSQAVKSQAVLTRLREALDQADYDFCVIDTPGNLGAEITVSFIASDVIIIPVTPSRWALRAISIVLRELESCRGFLKKLNGRAPEVYILPSQFGRSQKHDEILMELSGAKSLNLLNKIPRSESIQSRTENRQRLQEGSIPWSAYEELAGKAAKL